MGAVKSINAALIALRGDGQHTVSLDAVITTMRETGKDMRRAHASLDLNEAHFAAIAGHLQATLEELKVAPDLIAQVMAIVGSTKDAVLNRGEEKTSE